MTSTAIIRVQDLNEVEFDTAEEMSEYAVERAGEFASGMDLDVDITVHDLNVRDGEVVLEVDGAPEDVSLFSRRWCEEN